jgi:hypothetical protein
MAVRVIYANLEYPIQGLNKGDKFFFRKKGITILWGFGFSHPAIRDKFLLIIQQNRIRFRISGTGVFIDLLANSTRYNEYFNFSNFG